MTGFTHMLESCLAYAYSATYKCHIQLRPGPMQDSRIQVRHVERDSVNIIVHARWVHYRFGMILPIVHNLESIANFGNLNVFFLISMKFTWRPIFGEMCPWIDRGWAKFPSNYFVNEL